MSDGGEFLANLSQTAKTEEPQAEETLWEAVESDNIAAIRREDDGTVGIRFKNKKTGLPTGEYHYDNVPETLYEQMRASDSVGKFFAANIKSNPKDYPYRKHEADKDA